jgi:precorrin-3B C17-methyltransferase
MQSNGEGKIFVVGIGPGDIEHMSLKAYHTIKNADVIVGYRTYLKIIEELISSEQEVYSTGMRGEIERTEKAIEYALKGKGVAFISSGDPGVYGMAGLLLEKISSEDINIETEVIPGITSANAAAASLGAPLMHDYALISLSDLLTPWEKIAERLHKAAESDFVIVLYNPRSKKRIKQLKIARDILLKYKNSKTPVGIVKNAKRGQEEIIITNLEDILEHKIDMLTTVIIGNSKTFVINDKMITPRGYKL